MIRTDEIYRQQRAINISYKFFFHPIKDPGAEGFFGFTMMIFQTDTERLESYCFTTEGYYFSKNHKVDPKIRKTFEDAIRELGLEFKSQYESWIIRSFIFHHLLPDYKIFSHTYNEILEELGMEEKRTDIRPNAL